MIWLLRVQIAGRTWYLSSRSCEPQHQGADLPHHGALSVDGFGEEIDTTGGSITGPCTVEASLHLGDIEGWELGRDRQVLDGAPAEVALWEPGTVYAARWVLLRGYVSTGGEIPEPGDDITITITSALVDEASEWPDVDDVTSIDQWPNIPADSDVYDETDQPYPYPIGELGAYTISDGSTQRTSTVRIVIVDDTVAFELGVVAGLAIGDTSIRVWNDTTKDAATLTVTNTADSEGTIRAVVDFSTAPVGWLFDGSHEFYATDIDQGIVGDQSTSSPSSLGEVALYLLHRRYGDIGLERVDTGSWLAIQPMLAGWLLGLQLASADPLQVVSDELMPLCPALSIVAGPQGHRPVYLAGSGYGRRLIVGRDIYRRDEPAVYVDTEITNKVTVAYAPSTVRGDYRARISVGGTRDPLARASQALYGVRAATIETKATFARGTSGLSAQENVRMRAVRRPLIVYDAPADVALTLALGDRVRIEDEDRDQHDRAAWVVGRAVDEDAEMWRVSLLLVA